MSKLAMPHMVPTLVLSLAALSPAARAQSGTPCTTPQHRACIIFSDNLGDKDTLWFGYHPLGTCGIDSVLCGEGGEIPPPPPAGVFDASWRGRCGKHPRFDYLEYRGIAGRDTHEVWMNFGESDSITLRWSPGSIRAMCDSAFLSDLFGGLLGVNMKMDADSQCAFGVGLSQLRIFTFGQRLETGVHGPAPLPVSARLSPNYPNPFNPGTTISYFLPHSSFVTVRILDVLGREVALVVHEMQQPGHKSVRWNADNVASGVYLVRLETESFTDLKKMVLLR